MEEPRRLGGRYELGSVLGRGGMAEVYLAHDTRLGRTVAVKTLRVDLARDPSFQARFRREAQSAASLNHPSIVAVYDTGEDYVDGISIPYIVMEYVDGSTLRELLHSGRKLLPERAMEMTVGILQALEYSHRAGIVHRDIKPANVMLTRTGQVKVMDFGIARAMGDSGMTMTQTAAVIGTAQYLSPEQAKGEQVDARSDLYSTGCLLYELLTVRPPFVGDSPVAVAYQHVREEPQPPSVYDPEVTPAMDAIVLKALTKDPNYRYQSADEMRADIEAALDGQPVAAAAAMGSVGYGYSHPYGDSAATTALPSQPDSPHTSMLPPMRDEDGGYGYEDRPGRRRQKKSSNTSTVLLVVAGILVLVGAIFLGKALFEHKPADAGTTVPNFHNLSLADAKVRATNVDLTLVTGAPTFCADANVDKGSICKQIPAADSPIPSDKTVKVAISKGAPPIAVKDVTNDPFDAAKAQLVSQGFEVKEKVKTTTTQDKDIVLSMDPDAGTKLAAGSTVTLTVAEPPTQKPVPNVQNIDVNAAKTQLQQAGFNNIKVQMQPDQAAANTVIDQSPDAFTPETLGTQIVLTVSSGPQTQAPPQVMPDLHNQTVGQAKAALAALNLNLQVQPQNNAPDDAMVVYTNPPANTQLEEGETIQLFAFGGGGNNPGGPGGNNPGGG
ncbi:serine/threonine protein kinase [Streptomyces sp. DvalAA-14]|uniref:Stk1 family PASTA domain-containing Ser/Thr kinase n=1 Tax=unclassified Streptomyces TaxID=2593676 RepID=UPI00081BC237|nr:MULTISPECIES: Stk1 family PASTA domain-containing Ser/Thr kinase [unclassified Streptomyces]MYS18806.1 Stk1 family PASTA domain-containing Ser/Thr kinase [Streptomyces sp. SID4948]SCD29674.1 serine/threonine protein kinase [Streptomyces sp. DvalAA-14]